MTVLVMNAKGRRAMEDDEDDDYGPPAGATRKKGKKGKKGKKAKVAKVGKKRSKGMRKASSGSSVKGGSGRHAMSSADARSSLSSARAAFEKIKRVVKQKLAAFRSSGRKMKLSVSTNDKKAYARAARLRQMKIVGRENFLEYESARIRLRQLALRAKGKDPYKSLWRQGLKGRKPKGKRKPRKAFSGFASMSVVNVKKGSGSGDLSAAKKGKKVKGASSKGKKRRKGRPMA